MSPLNSLVGNEQSTAITEEVLPESQKVQGNSAQPQIEATPHQTTPLSFSTHLEQPSLAEIAHVLADFMFPDSSPEGAGSSAKLAEQEIHPLPEQESTRDSGEVNPQSLHTYPPTSKAQADPSGSSASAPDGGLNQEEKASMRPPNPKQEGSSTSGGVKPQSSGVFSSENKKQEGSAAISHEASTARQPQEVRRPQLLPRPLVQAGPSNSGTVKPHTEASTPALLGPLQPLRRVPSPAAETPEEESGGHSEAARFNTFAGKVTGEVSNVLSEAGGLAGNATVGKVGEGLFAAGGVWQTGAAASKFSSLLGSASSPEQKKQLLLAGLDLMKGLSNTVSGITGVQGLNGSPLAGKISSATWALSEGTNALTQGYEAIAAGKSLSPEQMVRLGQVIGSSLKTVGSVASAAGVSGNAPTIVQTVGTGFSIASGALNLHNKGYDVSSTANHYYNSFVGFLQSSRPKSDPEPVLGQYNPNAHDLV
ncbi:hypothetical protein BDD14_3773 [Edaphobacter modestus]|uniref:Uncharacterized protein n=1 Tax=Edaphobacter modestus TaxID=388466 RepID=A0A4Q7YWX3_9BACT|nr:hypothetical protein BDD14_3773 [Edaphobacter modestus]